MLRCCLGAYGCPNHAWMPSLGAGLIRLSQAVGSERPPTAPPARYDAATRYDATRYDAIARYDVTARHDVTAARHDVTAANDGSIANDATVSWITTTDAIPRTTTIISLISAMNQNN